MFLLSLSTVSAAANNFVLKDMAGKKHTLSEYKGKVTAQVIQRAIHALKEISLVYHLGYRSAPASLWSELHQLYFCAIQQSVEKMTDRKSTRLNSSHSRRSRMPSSA